MKINYQHTQVMSHTQKNSTAYCEENSRYFLDELRWSLNNVNLSYHMWGNSGKIQSNMVNIHGSLTSISLVYHKLIFSSVLGNISKQKYIHGASFLTPKYKACFAVFWDVFIFEQSVLARRRYINESDAFSIEMNNKHTIKNHRLSVLI